MTDLSTPDLKRIESLCSISRDTAAWLCSGARTPDSAGIHCARFALHIVMNVSLPNGYAWGVLQSPAYMKGRDVFRAPIEGHVCVMAMYAAELDAAGPDFVDFCKCQNHELWRAAIFRFAHSPRALDDERLMELSCSNDETVRIAVAGLLRWRQSPHRNEILARLINDPRRSVSFAASTVAGRTKDPELLDLLAAKGHLYSLSMAGDPRGRSRVEALSSSDDPLDWEESVAAALRLEDRSLLARLWRHHDWDTRSNAILCSAWQRLIDAEQLDGILVRENADQVVHLLLRWPHNDNETLLKMAHVLRKSIAGFPSGDALIEGRMEVLDRARAWATAYPKLSAALIRLVPNDTAVQLAMELLASPEAGARVATAEVVAWRGLTECFPRVAELCLDPEETVARAAADAVLSARMRCGVYGLDTAILKAGNDFSASIHQRQRLGSLIEKILTAQA